jgi:hypothetical protein
MGFYFRKAFSFGPLRLNLSKSGAGVSVGVKGARIGVTPGGRAYVHAGRGGFYFRQQIGSVGLSAPPTLPAAPRSPAHLPSPQPSRPSPSSTTAGPVERIESADTTQLRDASQAELVAELQRVRRRIPRTALVAGGFILAVAGGAWLGASDTIRLPVPGWVLAALVLAGGTVAASLKARRSDTSYGVARLTFNLDVEASKRIEALNAALRDLAACRRLWSIDTRRHTGDWKRNAGAQNLVTRNSITPSERPPRGVESNLPILRLPAGHQTLYFFPNALMVYDRRGIGVVPYGRILAEASTVRFTEGERLAGDCRVVGKTWQYVNKNGGPDRRFNHNRELPIVEYGGLSLKSDSGLNELFHASRSVAVEGVVRAIEALQAVSIQLKKSARPDAS